MTPFDPYKIRDYWDRRIKEARRFIGHRVYEPVGEWDGPDESSRLQVQCIDGGPAGEVGYTLTSQRTYRAYIAIQGDPVLHGDLLCAKLFKETSEEWGERRNVALILLDEWESARYGPRYPLMLETGEGWEGGPLPGFPDRTPKRWKYIDKHNAAAFREAYPGAITWLDDKWPVFGGQKFSKMLPSPAEHKGADHWRPVGYEGTLNCTGTMMLLRARYVTGEWEERYSHTVVIDDKRVINPGLWHGKYRNGTHAPDHYSE